MSCPGAGAFYAQERPDMKAPPGSPAGRGSSFLPTFQAHHLLTSSWIALSVPPSLVELQWTSRSSQSLSNELRSSSPGESAKRVFALDDPVIHLLRNPFYED